MELAHPIYPMRAVIRCKARQQLLSGLNADGQPATFDEALFKELATTLFRSHQATDLYQPCFSTEAASAVEDRLAAELTTTYRWISQQQENPLVQRLNSLLA